MSKKENLNIYVGVDGKSKYKNYCDRTSETNLKQSEGNAESSMLVISLHEILIVLLLLFIYFFILSVYTCFYFDIPFIFLCLYKIIPNVCKHV